MAALTKSRPKKLPVVPWTITRIHLGTPATYIGRVYARDEQTAIAKAIEEFGITNPEHQRRLMARRTD
jgi:hypothetical protein